MPANESSNILHILHDIDMKNNLEDGFDLRWSLILVIPLLGVVIYLYQGLLGTIAYLFLISAIVLVIFRPARVRVSFETVRGRSMWAVFVAGFLFLLYIAHVDMYWWSWVSLVPLCIWNVFVHLFLAENPGSKEDYSR
jgi:hypothetical protein